MRRDNVLRAMISLSQLGGDAELHLSGEMFKEVYGHLKPEDKTLPDRFTYAGVTLIKKP